MRATVLVGYLSRDGTFLIASHYAALGARFGVDGSVEHGWRLGGVQGCQDSPVGPVLSFSFWAG